MLALDAEGFTLRHGSADGLIPTNVQKAAWTNAEGHLENEALTRMFREILRDCGIQEYEPGPPAAAT